jgi:hypothetical protein
MLYIKTIPAAEATGKRREIDQAGAGPMAANRAIPGLDSKRNAFRNCFMIGDQQGRASR